MMPAIMINEAPLPTPYSVISSPIHMTSRAPARSAVVTMKNSATGLPDMLGSTIWAFGMNTPV